jgi:hypothetical protein
MASTVRACAPPPRGLGGWWRRSAPGCSPPRCPARLHLRRSVRPRRRRLARRASGDHPLAANRPAAAPIPADRRAAQPVLRRRRRYPHLGRRDRRSRRVPPPDPNRPRRRRRQRMRPSSRRPVQRAGGQAQYIERLVPESSGGELAALRYWMLENLTQPLSIDTLAERAHMSRRNAWAAGSDAGSAAPQVCGTGDYRCWRRSARVAAILVLTAGSVSISHWKSSLVNLRSRPGAAHLTVARRA